jgi:hypothetical protein
MSEIRFEFREERWLFEEHMKPYILATVFRLQTSMESVVHESDTPSARFLTGKYQASSLHTYVRLRLS